jgi:hypothetical protein
VTRPRYTLADLLADAELRHRLITVVARGLGEDGAVVLLDEYAAEAIDGDDKLTFWGWVRRIRAWVGHEIGHGRSGTDRD